MSKILTEAKLSAIKTLIENSFNNTFDFNYAQDKSLYVRFSAKDVIFTFHNDGIKSIMKVSYPQFNSMTFGDFQRYVKFYFNIKEDEE